MDKINNHYWIKIIKVTSIICDLYITQFMHDRFDKNFYLSVRCVNLKRNICN